MLSAEGADGVAAERPGVIVHHCRQPGPVRFAVGAADEDVELGVVCLPDLVWAVGAAAKDKFMPVPVGCGTVNSHGHQGRVQCLDDVADDGVARRRGASSARFGRG